MTPRRSGVSLYVFVQICFVFDDDEEGSMCYNVDLAGQLQSFASVGSIGVSVGGAGNSASGHE